MPVEVEIRVKGKPKQSVIAPVADFLTDIDERCGGLDAVFDLPDAPRLFPYEHASGGGEGQSYGLVPVVADGLVEKIRGQRRGGRRPRKDDKPSECPRIRLPHVRRTPPD